jgi:uncharacterized cysteine cluster protein YcgN (CxxCxxCC family)
MTARPFWEAKTLAEMSPAEWESLCDGCGLCCLVRFEDEDSGLVTPTRVACKLLDTEACRCSDYENRRDFVPDCIKLTTDNVTKLAWMPKSCAYRRLAEGRGLASWHPLVSGDPESVHRAGVSIRGQTISEADLAHPDDALDYMAPDLLDERGLARRPRGATSGRRTSGS